MDGFSGALGTGLVTMSVWRKKNSIAKGIFSNKVIRRPILRRQARNVVGRRNKFEQYTRIFLLI